MSCSSCQHPLDLSLWDTNYILNSQEKEIQIYHSDCFPGEKIIELDKLVRLEMPASYFHLPRDHIFPGYICWENGQIPGQMIFRSKTSVDLSLWARDSLPSNHYFLLNGPQISWISWQVVESLLRSELTNQKTNFSLSRLQKERPYLFESILETGWKIKPNYS